MGAKRSQRRSVRYEKDQSGCMWGLISMFDFRHGRTTRKLIADKKHGSKHISGPGISKNKFEALRNLEENCQYIIDGEDTTIGTVNNAGNKPSVKKLIEEEMVNEQCPKKDTRDGVTEPNLSEPVDEDQIKAGHKKAKKTRKKSRDMDNPDPGVTENVQSDRACKHSNKNNPDHQSVKDLSIDEIMEEISRRIQQKSITCAKDGQNGEGPELLGDSRLDYEEKLRVAIKEFVVQKLTNGKHLKDQKIRDSKELMNELELISSDEELFMKLAQDPKSMLVKYVQNLQDSKVEKDDESVQKLADVRKSEDLITHKHRSFFRRKAKSQERNLVKEDDNPDTLSRIVILKPGPLVRSTNIATDKEESDRVGSHFFLSEIKRRLKHAMGKQHGTEALDKPSNKRQTKGDTEKNAVKGNVGRNSPTKEHFYMERKPSVFSKRADKINKAKDPETSQLGSNVTPNERISNIYVEAKKHLLELLSSGEDCMEFPSQQNPKTLGRILSLPEYNTSPAGSPGRNWEKSFVTARTRFSSKDKSQNVDETSCSPKGQNNEIPSLSESPGPITVGSSDHKVPAPNSSPKSGVCDDIVHDINVEQTVKDETSHEDDTTHVKEDGIVFDSFDEPSGSSSTRDDQNGNEDDKRPASLEQDSNEENTVQCSSPPGSPSGSLITSKVSDLEIATELPERPSPVSILELVFIEDDINPTNTISQSIKLTMQPLQIQFEEPDCPRRDESPNEKRCVDNKDVVFSYVKAVIQASVFDWDEVCFKLLSSDQLLNPAIADEVELFSDQLCCDERLLFDCINEVLVELCQYFFGSSPWVSFKKRNIRPIPDVKSATLETFKGVCWHLLKPPLPRSLDQIVGKDMERTRTWLDTRFESETIGFDMGEAILQDLVEDTILSYVDENSETETW